MFYFRLFTIKNKIPCIKITFKNKQQKSTVNNNFGQLTLKQATTKWRTDYTEQLTNSELTEATDNGVDSCSDRLE